MSVLSVVHSIILPRHSLNWIKKNKVDDKKVYLQRQPIIWSVCFESLLLLYPLQIDVSSERMRWIAGLKMLLKVELQASVLAANITLQP